MTTPSPFIIPESEITKYANRIVTAAPAFTPAQRQRLALLLIEDAEDAEQPDKAA